MGGSHVRPPPPKNGKLTVLQVMPLYICCTIVIFNKTFPIHYQEFVIPSPESWISRQGLAIRVGLQIDP